MSSSPSSKKLPTSAPLPPPSPHVPTMGAPRFRPTSGSFSTKGGVIVHRQLTLLSRSEFEKEADSLVNALDERRGCIFESSYEYPGRYARWTMGFVDPPLVLEGRARHFEIRALNERGQVLLPAIYDVLERCKDVHTVSIDNTNTQLMQITGTVRTLPDGTRFPEEQRSKQPSIFSVVREMTALFGIDPAIDPQLGLYGSFGYDLTFQFETVKFHHQRDINAEGRPTQRDLLLYLPDSIIVLDGQAKDAYRVDYDFSWNNTTTRNMERTGNSVPFTGVTELKKRRDHAPGAYSKKVDLAKEQFRVGNLFECVLSQVFYEPCAAPPSEILRRLRIRNPSPYMFIINLGSGEHLVGRLLACYCCWTVVMVTEQILCSCCSPFSSFEFPSLFFVSISPHYTTTLQVHLPKCLSAANTRTIMACVSRHVQLVAPSNVVPMRWRMPNASKRF